MGVVLVTAMPPRLYQQAAAGLRCKLQVRQLPSMYHRCILICMRTTLNLDESTFRKASELTGIREKTALVHRGLQTLIQLESARRLAALGGTEKQLKRIPRRHPRAER